MRREKLAIKPNDGETFLREVDEELRKDRLNQFVARWGWALVASFVLLLAAIGGYLWWQNRQQAEAAKQGETLLEALDSMESGARSAAATKIATLGQSDVTGYRAAALFARANSELAANNRAAALATLRDIAGNQDFAEPYRQAALVRQTAIEFDTLPPQQVIQRLQPLARPGQAYFGSAGEMVAVAHLKMRRPDLAGPLFAAIGRDVNVPPSIRTRTIQMAGSLGFNAIEEPAAPAAAAPAPAPAAAPTAAREKAQ
jgi:hypothetical protein